jgi:hypothetical protein
LVYARLVPLASRLTTGELAARIKKLAIALDPQWAARRYATAVRERNVIGYLNDDGSATVTGSALSLEQAAAACAHVAELARAAKRAGHPGRIGPLRADLYLGLLDGRWQHCTRDQIITDLLSRPTTDTDTDTTQTTPTIRRGSRPTAITRLGMWPSPMEVGTARQLPSMRFPSLAARRQRCRRGGWGWSCG